MTEEIITHHTSFNSDILYKGVSLPIEVEVNHLEKRGVLIGDYYTPLGFNKPKLNKAQLNEQWVCHRDTNTVRWFS